MAKKKLRDADDLATPRTRTERYLAHMAGKLVDLPAQQFSRLERYLKAIADRIDSGGGGGGEDKQPQIVYVEVTLVAANWSSNAQTVTVTGVSATETAQLIQPVPASASRAEYESCQVKATVQAANSLTFECGTVPANDLTVYVCLTELEAAA